MTRNLGKMTATSELVAAYLPWNTPRLIKHEADYQHALATVESMMSQELSEEESELFDLLTNLIEQYEESHYPIDDADPRTVLLFLMEQRGFKQSDLVGVIGSSGVVSEVVQGKREISKQQARALGQLFAVDYTLFL